jgi:hypothetical protein
MAEWKAKEGELTPAELLKFGILPPEPDKPERRGKGPAAETLDETPVV